MNASPKPSNGTSVFRDPSAMVALGRHCREVVPRASHAKWQPPKDRPDPVAVLHTNDAGRLPALVPIRYQRMLGSAFAFYRGAAAIMANDLASTPATGIRTQLCGDAHLLNFGAFATPERRLVFDVNDFDETLAGPWEWDVKRLATSFAIAGRYLNFRTRDTTEAVLKCVRSYREKMSAFAGMHVLDVWYARLDQTLLNEVVQSALERRPPELSASDASTHTAAHHYPKFVRARDGKWKITDAPPLLFHPTDDPAFIERVRGTFDNYCATLPPERRAIFDRFSFADAAYKVVGVGSVGTRCLIALFVANDDDLLVLQAKEARQSALEPFLGSADVDCQGERVVVGQRLMQAASDLFLGWARSQDGYDFYFRQLRDLKTSANIERMNPSALRAYATFCGWALARAHAKAGGRAATIRGYLGNKPAFDEAITMFADDYAQQNQRDFETVTQALRPQHA